MHEPTRCQGSTGQHADPATFRGEVRAWLAAQGDARDGDRLARWRGGHPAGDALTRGAALVRLLWDAGWGRAGWPVEVGGGGGSLLLRQVLIDELYRAGVEVPEQYAPLEVMAPALIDLAPDLAAELLPRFLRGDEWWVQGFSEPEAGSDIAALRTRAVRRGEDGDDGFVLNGQKIWGSHGATSTRAYVLARTGAPDSRHRGLTMLLVDLDSPGVTVRPIALASGVDHLSEMFLDDVRVPATRVIGEVDGGWAALMRLLQYERGSYAWLRQGLLGQRLREALAGAAVGADAGSVGADAGSVGAAYLKVLAVRARSAGTVRRLAAGEAVGPETSVDKILLGWAEHAVPDLVRALHPHGFLLGGSGSPDLEPWLDHWWYSRATTIFGGAGEVQRGLVADRVLRLPAEKS